MSEKRGKNTHCSTDLANLKSPQDELKRQLLSVLKGLVGQLSDLGVSNQELSSILLGDCESIPVTVFDNDKLSTFEALVKFLHENRSLDFSKIGELLLRQKGVIAVTYKRAAKKMPEPLVISETPYSIPVESFCNSKLSIMESIVKYLKEKLILGNSQIGRLIHRDERTIWTVYFRVKKKESGK